VIALERARSHLETLGLGRAAEILDARLQNASAQQLSYVDFLADILDEELAQRNQRNVETRTRLARFPFKKTLGDFDFDFQPSVDKKQIRELASLSFLNQATNLLFLGPPGVGKMVCCYSGTGTSPEKLRRPTVPPGRSQALSWVWAFSPRQDVG
jgi:DNA replication protein DnaC